MTARRFTLLDAFSGAGGAAAGYARAGFDVVGVDIRPQPRYPFSHQVGDALEYIRQHGQAYDAIHASPPCQAFTAYRRKGYGVGDGYPDLIAETRAALEASGRLWVIENVPSAPLLPSAITLCGSSFGLDVRRHRRFEANWPLVGRACEHAWQTPRFPPATNRTNLRRTIEIGVWRIPLAVQQHAMGIDWMELEELSEALPPAYTTYVGEQLLARIGAASGVLLQNTRPEARWGDDGWPTSRSTAPSTAG